MIDIFINQLKTLNIYGIFDMTIITVDIHVTYFYTNKGIFIAVTKTIKKETLFKTKRIKHKITDNIIFVSWNNTGSSVCHSINRSLLPFVL